MSTVTKVSLNIFWTIGNTVNTTIKWPSLTVKVGKSFFPLSNCSYIMFRRTNSSKIMSLNNFIFKAIFILKKMQSVPYEGDGGLVFVQTETLVPADGGFIYLPPTKCLSQMLLHCSDPWLSAPQLLARRKILNQYMCLTLGLDSAKQVTPNWAATASPLKPLDNRLRNVGLTPPAYELLRYGYRWRTSTVAPLKAVSSKPWLLP